MKRCVLVLLLFLSAGCADCQPYVSSTRLEEGLVIVLPGIEGASRFNREICQGLAEGGVGCAIETYDWTSVMGPLYNLRAKARNRRQAAQVADRVVRYQMAHPGRPVWLVGQSGGGAIAVWAAEALPPEHAVEGIVLLAASISPNYVLDLAIRRSRRGIVSFHSARDWFLLTTNVTGTMDGEMSTSAGRTGFLWPEASAGPPAGARLYQVPWDRQMSRAGHKGGHLTSGAAGFVARYVAPLLRLTQWSEEAIERVMADGNGAVEEPPLPASRPRPASPATRPAGVPLARPGPVPAGPTATPPATLPAPLPPSPSTAPAPDGPATRPADANVPGAAPRPAGGTPPRRSWD